MKHVASRRMSSFSTNLIVIIGLLAAASAWGADAPAPADYSTLLGRWQGEARLDATMRGQRDPKAHSVVAATLDVSPDGKVVGTLGEKSCRLQGVGSLASAPNTYRLNLMVSGCRTARFNRRYTGTLGLYASSGKAKLSLHSAQRSAPAPLYSVDADLRR